MDIRSKRLKGYFVLSVLIIACLVMASTMIFISPKNNAEAVTDDMDLDLLLDDYGEAGITKAFNTKVFWNLISKISNGQVTDESGFSSLGATPVGSDVLRSYNNGQDIIVNIGGKQWIATYLSRTDNGPILTFWLEHSTTTSTWSTANNNANSWASQYTPNLYGTSFIRAVTLNIGGNYADSSTHLTSHTQNAENEWAIYTMDKSEKSGSIKDFLEVPNNVSWQLDQKALDYVNSSAYTGSYKYNNNNDALNYGSTETVAATGNYKTRLGNDNNYYTAWGTDTLWLPSIAETGLSGVEGIWKAADSTRVNTNQNVYSSLRSAASRLYFNAAYAIHQNSGTLIDPYCYQQQGVRPAFHLKLEKAAGAVGISLPKYKKTANNKDDNIKYYNSGNDVTFELDKIDTDLIKTVSITATDMNGDAMTYTGTPSYANGVMSFKVQNVGKYTVKVTPIDGECWSDGTTSEKSYTYYLKYAVSPLTWTSLSSKPYNGQTQYFEVSNYDEDKMIVTPAPIKVSKDGSGKITQDANGTLWAISAKDVVKDREVEIKLKNTTFMNWKEDDGTYSNSTKKIKYSITEKTLNFTPVDNKPWSVSVNTSDKTYDVYVDICEEDIDVTTPLSFEMWYKKDEEGATEFKIGVISPKFEVDPDTGEVVEPKKIRLTLTMPSVDTKGDYKYILKLASGSSSNANYMLNASNSLEVNSFKAEAKKIDIKEADVIWRYTNAKLSKDNYTIVDKTDPEKYDAVNKIYNLDYNGAEYDFSVDTSKLDTDGKYEVVNGTVVGTKADGKTSVKKATNVKLKSNGEVDYYEVIFTIKVKDGVTGVEVETDYYTLKYRINKAKFDLSDVTWDYDPAKPKEYNKGLSIEVKLKDLPMELTPDYGDDTNKKSAVCQINSATQEYIPYKAIVTFKKLTGDIANNYVLPVKSDRSSYICKDELGNDKDFPWELEWIIKKAELDLESEWEKVATEDTNGVIFRVYKVTDATLASRLDYDYYAEDDWDEASGMPRNGATAKKLEDIVVDLTGDPVKYWAVAKVNTANAKNYEIKKGTEAKKFTVGASTVINVDIDKAFIYDGKAHGLTGEFTFDTDPDLTDAIANVIVKKYYLVETDEYGQEKKLELKAEDLPNGAPTKAGKYIVSIDFKDEVFQDNFALSKFNISFEIKQAELNIALDGNKNEFVYDGEDLALKLNLSCDNKLDVSGVKIVKTYYVGTEIKEDGSNRLAEGVLPKNVGKYIVVLSIDETDEDNYRNYKIKDTCIQFNIEITPYQITAEWDTTGEVPTLKGLTAEEKEIIEYVYYDEDGKEVGVNLDVTGFEAGKYKVMARIKSEYEESYRFIDKKGNVLTNPTSTDEQEFEIKAENPDDPIVPVDPENPEDPNEPQPTIDIVQIVKEYWQPILSAICIILTIIFMSKGIGYAGKRKKVKKTIEKKYSTAYYAVGGVGLFNLPYTTWTVIACILAGVTVLAFIFMLLEKKSLGKAEEELEDAKDEYAKSQKEAENKQMQMMLMGMMGGNGQGGQGFAYQQGVSADEMRMMLNDAVTAMLPNVTQYLPQQASTNDDLMRKIEEQNEENEERIRQLTESNEKAIEKLVEKLSKQQVVEKQVEREVAATNANDEKIDMLIKTNESLIRNQEMLMKQIVELASSKGNDKQIVMPYMQQPVVQQPAEKVVERIIEKPVEKIVEKEVVKEVPIEVEKVVEKVVEIPAEKPAPKAKKAPARRLTLDEAYAKLSDKQKKIFDTLKDYAMSKDKCKEKKSTYFIVLGQSTVNPLVKLTIKKNTTVALFKMEDEYFKDIRRNAGSDGTKVKVKESEVVVSDNQALSTAKDMIDLREDQIERYNEYLREQRSMKRK